MALKPINWTKSVLFGASMTEPGGSDQARSDLKCFLAFQKNVHGGVHFGHGPLRLRVHRGSFQPHLPRFQDEGRRQDRQRRPGHGPVSGTNESFRILLFWIYVRTFIHTVSILLFILPPVAFLRDENHDELEAAS